MTSSRSTIEVFEDHLDLALKGDVATDIARNFSDECVLLTGYGVFRGHEGVREAADLLARQLPDARFEYVTRLFHDEVAFLEWRGYSEEAGVDDGADSFFIRDGRIRVMTIHYTVRDQAGAVIR